MKLESLKMNLKSLKSRVNNQKCCLFNEKIAKSPMTFRKNKANFKNNKIGVSPFETSRYEIFPAWRGKKTNPNKPKANPILAHYKGYQSQYKAKQTHFVIIALAGKLVYSINSYYDYYYKSISRLIKMKLAKVTIMLILFTMLSSCRGSVMTGLDCVDSHSKVFQGKRIGIITNHTAYDSKGKYIVDVFKGMPGVAVQALFSPEHGLWGKEQDAIKIGNQVDPVYRLQIYSLYGKTLKPTPQMLQDIDILIFDIQDIGARFYTYIYTMSLAMEAAAENGKRFIVLDRPNPINGNCVEGNLLEPDFSSFVGLYRIPVRHGMTAGELAKMFNDQGWLKDGVKADLVIVPMKGWYRRMWYDQTGLAFIKTSPNMPDLQTAAIYPGLCLLEGTNISEGRRTEMPFLQFGAPWIDSRRLAERLNKLDLPGMHFEPVSFTPSSSKYKDQVCNGAKITVTDRDRLEPYFSGIRIVNEIYRMYPQDFQWKVKHFDRLCGSSKIRNAISNQLSLNRLRNKWQVELESFQKIRKKYLIYPD